MDQRHTIAGMISTFIGIIIIVISSYLYDEEIFKGNIHVPVLIMIIGIFFQSIQRVYEELLLQKIEVSVYRFVGLEGLFGFFFIILVQFFFNMIYSTSKENSDTSHFIQMVNPGVATAMIGKSKTNSRCEFAHLHHFLDHITWCK
jgi:hypothetical protein